MKIQKFLNCVQAKILNYPDINLYTVKIFMDKFKFYLSDLEKDRFNLTLQLIESITSKQITIDTYIHKDKIDNLEKQYNNLVKGNKVIK